MATLTVKGGIPLVGKVHVSGSKNAALPILFSSLAVKGISKISRVPDISDVRVAIKIIESCGARVQRDGEVLFVDTRELVFSVPDPALTSRIRASSYLLGASLARFGKSPMPSVGGCNFSPRPTDLHIAAALAFGAERKGDHLVCKNLHGAEIAFPKRSVGATANAMIIAASVKGESIIRGHAREPHITALADFLRSAGANIDITDEKITVRGCELHGGECEIIGDMIEAGSYLAAAVVTDGCVGVSGIDTAHMGAFLSFLEKVGCNISICDGLITVRRGKSSKYTEITAEPYPAYPTDLQPIAAPILAALSGGKISDKVFPERFGYLDKLGGFGVKYIKEESSVKILPSRLTFSEAELPDLRGGMSCLLTAIGARGESCLESAEVLLRGYENIEKKLSALGADIEFKSK